MVERSHAVLDQLPRFSEFDPGAVGEGSLDPLGLGAVAERLAEQLAPGVSARMSQPRFVTASAVGALACQSLSDLTSSDGKTTFDIAFEWLLVEALVRHPHPDRLRGLPGSQKATRAAKVKERLSAATYLTASRVFGFTGVYRPLSQDLGVLGRDGLAAGSADELLRAWEMDQRLRGFVDDDYGSQGLGLRREIEKECRSSLFAGRSTLPRTGWLAESLANSLAPREAKKRERVVLRRLIAHGSHEIRNELAALLETQSGMLEDDEAVIAQSIRGRASHPTRAALDAAAAFERCAVPLENAYRRLLAYGTSLNGAFTVAQGTQTPQLEALVPRLHQLTSAALDSVGAIDESLARDVDLCFREFDDVHSASDLVDSLIRRHQQVQDGKGKLMWLDQIKDKWVVRPPYRGQRLDLSDEVWIHPMRLRVLVSFLGATA